MNKELRKKIIKALNEDSFEKLSLTIEEKEEVLSSKEDLAQFFLEQLIDRGKVFCSEEDTKKILKQKPEIIEKYLAEARHDLYCALELPENFRIDDIIFDGIYSQFVNIQYLQLLKDKTRLIDYIGNISDYACDEICFLAKTVPDEIIEKMVLDPRNQDERKQENLIGKFKNDKYIVKYLDRLSDWERCLAIMKLQDDNLKKQYISLLSRNKGDIIGSFNSDEEKINYLKKYNLVLSSADKARIFELLNDKRLIRENRKYIKSQKDFLEVVSRCYKYDRELFNASLLKIEGDTNINKLIEYIDINSIDYEVAVKILNKISSQKVLAEALYDSDNKIAKVILPKMNEKTIKNYIEEYMGPSIPIEAFLYLKDDSLLFETLSNSVLKAEYYDGLLPIFEKVSKRYNLNLNNLIELAKLTNCGILSQLNNKNIRNAVNLNEENFKKYIEIFSKQNQSIDLMKINAVLVSCLHKKFTFDNPNEISTFVDTIQNIEINNYPAAKALIEKVYSVVKDKKGITLEDLEKGLLAKDQKITDLYHNMTFEYLREKRTDYVTKNMPEAKYLSTGTSFEKNSCFKYFYTVYPTDYIIDFIYNSGALYSKGLSPEYKNLINDKLLREIVEFKKGNIRYEEASEEVKKNIKLFENICDMAFSRKANIDFYSYQDFIQLYPQIQLVHYPKQENPDFSIFEIMANTNVEQLKDQVFPNEEMYQNLLKHLQTYGMIGWQNCFEKITSSIDIDLTPDIVGAFISNYAAIEKERKSKEKEGKEVTFISEMALAELLDSKSNIYTYLLGEEDFRYFSRNYGSGAIAGSLFKTDRLKQAVSLLPKMKERSKITVPPIDEDINLSSNKSINISIGETNNPINFTLGERTGACMRIGGAASSLFEFCMLNENGFHLTFRDPKTGQLISRASGVRNGNTVFLNELKFPTNAAYTNEEIKEACKLAAEEIIRKTKDSEYPISNVLVSGVGECLYSGSPTTQIGNKRAQDGLYDFYTDYKGDKAVVVATANNGELVPVKTGPNNAERYDVTRMKPKKVTNKAEIAIGRIEALDQLYAGKKVEEIEISPKEEISYAYVGEDWYVIVQKDGKVISYVEENIRDKNKAVSEMNQYINIAQHEVKQSTNGSNITYMRETNQEVMEVDSNDRKR